MRKTKIVCTIGPACSSADVMEKMLRAGMNVARFNFSHGDHEYHKTLMDTFKSVRDKLKLPAAILLDTKGPEIRLKNFEGGKATLKKGNDFILTSRAVEGTEREAEISYAPLVGQLVPGTRILIDDGKVALTVKESTKTDIV